MEKIQYTWLSWGWGDFHPKRRALLVSKEDSYTDLKNKFTCVTKCILKYPQFGLKIKKNNFEEQLFMVTVYHDIRKDHVVKINFFILFFLLYVHACMVTQLCMGNGGFYVVPFWYWKEFWPKWNGFLNNDISIAFLSKWPKDVLYFRLDFFGDFRPSVFFHRTIPHRAMIHGLKPFRIWLQIRRDIRDNRM
jgi:hypothetical protein